MSRAASSRVRLLLALSLVIGMSALAHGDADSSARFQRLGAQLICPCGCTQGALVCNHVGCPIVTKLRAEVTARAASTDSDELVLQSFVQEYGSQVMAVPSTHGFNLLAWIMPWIACAIGLAFLVMVLRHWNGRREPAPTVAAGSGESLSRVQREVEEQIRREWD